MQLALDLNVPIPNIYGEIKRNADGELYTTKAKRTGCEICGFGIHLEERPHRFDKLYQRNPKAWEHWMNECCVDENGERYGWGRVLDYLGIKWRQNEGRIPQTSVENFLANWIKEKERFNGDY